MINSFQEIEESFTDERTTYWSIYSPVLPFLSVLLLVILLPTQPTHKTCVLCIYTFAFQSNARKLSLIFNSLFFFSFLDPTVQKVMSTVLFKCITILSTFLHIYYFHPISNIIIYLLNYCNSLQTDFTTSTLSHQQFALHRELLVMTHTKLLWKRDRKIQWI